MNNFINKILCIFVLTFSSLAMAGDEVSKETIFVNSTTIERWSDFKKSLNEYDGITLLGNIRTITLAQVAYEYAKAEGFPAGKMSFNEFNSLFKEQNNLSDIVNEAEFLTQARAGKIFLPTVTVKESVANSIPVNPVKTEESVDLKAQAETIAALKKEVEQLSLVVAKNTTWQKNWEEKLGGFFNQFNSLKNKVAALGQEQGNLVQTQASEFKKLAAELTEKTNSVSFLVKDFTKVVSGLQDKVQSFESSSITTNVLKKWFVIAGAALAILFLLAFWFISRKFKDVQENKVSVRAFDEVKNSIASVKENLELVAEDVGHLQRDVYKAGNDVTLAKDLRSKISNLFQNGDEFKTIVEKGGASFVVTVMYSHSSDAGNRYVLLEGVKDQNRPVSIKNVPSVLYRAASDDRLLNENFSVVKEAA